MGFGFVPALFTPAAMVDNPASFPVLASALPPDSKSVLAFLKALLGPI
jgi:hypothetical protein